MHCARLLVAAEAHLGEPVDRSGRGRILAVYPAAALRNWRSISPRTSENPGTYKGTSDEARERREWIVEQICRCTSPWLDIGPKVQVVRIDNDDCLDALICALVARAADAGLLEPDRRSQRSCSHRRMDPATAGRLAATPRCCPATLKTDAGRRREGRLGAGGSPVIRSQPLRVVEKIAHHARSRYRDSGRSGRRENRHRKPVALGARTASRPHVIAASPIC
jgi:Protein of unknown function (DUF429)